jgi:two-component system OmpR family response regulator
MTAKKTILCVDDEHSLSIHKVTLETRGYRVLACATAAEADSILAEHGVDLVLSAMELPDAAITELVRRIKAHDAGTPVVLLSSSKCCSPVDVSVELLLKKGYAPCDLLSSIRVLISKRRGARRAASADLEGEHAAC